MNRPLIKVKVESFAPSLCRIYFFLILLTLNLNFLFLLLAGYSHSYILNYVGAESYPVCNMFAYFIKLSRHF